MIKKINIQTAIKRCLLTFAIMASTVVALAQEGSTYVAQIHKDAVYYVEGDEIPEGNKVGDIKTPEEYKKYETLKAAIDDANGAESQTIELLADVTLDAAITIPDGLTVSVASEKTITIELSGNNISGAFTNAGNLTITDSSTGENATPGTVSTLTNNGTLTLSKGFITTLTAGNGSSVTTSENATITTLSVAENATTTISGNGYNQISGTGTVKLGNDLNNISILTGSSITLDLNGHTITSTSTNAAITNAGTLSFENSSTDGSKVTIPTITNNGTLTIDKCDVTTLANNSGSVTIESESTVTTLNNDGGSITVNGTVTSFSNYSETTIKGAGISTITGAGTIKLGDERSAALTISSESGITLDLNGKTAANVTASGKVVVKDSSTGENAGTITTLTASESAEITVESGTITALDASANGTKVNIKGGTVGTLNPGTNTEVKFTNITTEEGLNTAIALTKKSVIELATDITLTNACAITLEKNITIDLKGNSITGTITNAGTFVLNDAGKKATQEEEPTYGTVKAISNTGTVTVNNGKVVETLTATDGTTTVNGGTISGITVSNNATATINSGSTIGTLTANNNKVQINGGSINTIAGEGTIDFPAVNSADLLSLALKANKATVKLTGKIEGNVADGFKLADGANITINVNGQTVTNTGGNTFEIPAGSLLSLTGSGKIENATDGMVAVNNAGTFTLSGPEVASATLNGTQTIEGGTLDAATLSNNQTINVSGGTIKVLTTTSNNKVNTTSGTVEHLANAADATTTISGNGFKEFSGSGTITLDSNISSNLTVKDSGTDLILALGSHTISNHEQANTVNVASGAQLTVTGTGSITNNSDASTAISNEGTTNISGGTIASATSTDGTLNIYSGATVTTLKAGAGNAIIKGGAVTNLNGEGTIKLGADIENECTVTGGNVTLDLNGHTLNTATGDAPKTVTVNESATLNVKDSSTDANGSVGKINNIGTTTVKSGTVKDLTSSGTVTFTGGAITTLTVDGGTASIKANKVGTLNANGGTVTIDVEGHKPETMNIGSGAKVTIGDKTYDFSNIKTADELTQALAMTKSGTLKLGGDNINITGEFTVPAGSDITIDLNGHKIKANSGTALTVAGTLKVLGSGTATVSSVATTSENTGNFTLEGATVTTLSNAGATTLTSGTVGTITASTGTLEIKDATVGEATATGTTKITAGTITTLTTSAGTTNISGGTVTTLNGTAASDITISNGNITKASAGKKMTVSGGTIGTLSTTASTNGDGDDDGLKISAGEITTLNVIESSKADVSGGTIGTIDVYDATLNVAEAAHVTTYTGTGGDNVKLPSYSITDTNAGSYPIKFIATTASYIRESGIDNSNRWGTVCLPFEITKEVTGVKFYKVKELETDKLNLDEYTITADAPIAAGTPVVFHIEGSTDVETFKIESENATVNQAPTTKEQAGTDVKLVGTFEQKLIDNQTDLTNIYYISDNAFHQAKAKLTVPIYRAYLMVTSSNGAKPRMIYFNEEDDATGIQSMLADGAEIAGYYDLNGVCHETPQKGMNIVKMKNGKSIKLMIK